MRVWGVLIAAVVAVLTSSCSDGPERPEKLRVGVRQDAAHVYVTFTNPNRHLVAQHVHYTLSLRDQHGAFLASYLEMDRRSSNPLVAQCCFIDQMLPGKRLVLTFPPVQGQVADWRVDFSRGAWTSRADK